MRTLADTSKAPLAKLAKMAGEKESDTGVQITSDNSTMFNTRVQKDLVKRLKRYCLENDITLQQAINELIAEKVEAEGF